MNVQKLEGHNLSLGAALESAKQRFAAANPRSKELFDYAQDLMPGGNTRTALHFDPFPLYMKGGSGANLFDADGHIYLDALGEFTAGLYGHNDPHIRAAVDAALDGGISNGAPGLPEIKLAEAICSRFPSIERLRFCNSGTEANLYALTLAMTATKRHKLIAFSGAYHGGIFIFADGGNPMNAPYDWTVCRYNDVESTRRAIDGLGASLAAVIVEPMQSNGGCIPATKAFLDMLRERTKAHGALLVFDEIVTSRMSAGGMQERLGIRPDLTTLGKYIGGGFATGAFGGRADIIGLMDPTRVGALPHAGTFNNAVVAMQAGAVGFEKVFTAQAAERLFTAGEYLRGRLNALARRQAPSVQFTGAGSCINIHFCPGPISCPEDLVHEKKSLFALFHLDLIEDGVYAARRGQINLSLPMTEADFDKIKNAVGAFLLRRRSLLDA